MVERTVIIIGLVSVGIIFLACVVFVLGGLVVIREILHRRIVDNDSFQAGKALSKLYRKAPRGEKNNITSDLKRLLDKYQKRKDAG